MKIIRTDNFSRDYEPDSLIAENVNSYYGKIIVELLNTKETDNSENYFMLVEDNYKLLTIEDIY